MTGRVGHRGLLLGAGSQYSAAVLASGPICYWRLGETSGTTAADASGNGRTGTYQVNASTITTPGLLTGDGNPGILLPSTSTPISGVSIASNPISANGDFTCEVILKPSGIPPASGGIGCVLQLGANGAGCPELDIENVGGGNFRFRFMRSGTGLLFNSSSTWAYGTKLHVVLNKSGTTTTLRVNAGAQGSGSFAFTSATSATRLGYAMFGATNDYQMPGVIDEMAFYASSLSTAATDAHYALI